MSDAADAADEARRDEARPDPTGGVHLSFRRMIGRFAQNPTQVTLSLFLKRFLKRFLMRRLDRRPLW
jgi:hypothetical protein